MNKKESEHYKRLIHSCVEQIGHVQSFQRTRLENVNYQFKLIKKNLREIKKLVAPDLSHLTDYLKEEKR